MRKTRMIRNVNKTGNQYQIWGYFLTEKAKAALRRKGLKTDDNTWADVFPKADVVYRFNPAKNKSDVFVGIIQASRYSTTGNRKTLSMIDTERSCFWTFEHNVPVSKKPHLDTFTVANEKVVREALLAPLVTF